jgi:hypothetical protein
MGTTHLDQLQVSGVPTFGTGTQLPLANNYWFVSSVIGSNNFDGKSYSTPWATLAFAAANASLGTGDCIVVMEGHAETIAVAAGIALATAGVYVIGLGAGTYRPTFTFSTATTATWTITAASVTVANIVCVNNIDQLAVGFSISAANVTLGTSGIGQNGGYVEWQDPDNSHQTIRPVLTTAAADKLIINMKFIGPTSGGTAPVNGIRLVGCDSGLINIDYYGQASTSVVEFVTTACTNIEVYGYMYNSSSTTGAKDVVDTQGSSTWYANINDGAAGETLTGGSAATFGGVVSQVQDQVATSATAVLTNGTHIFTVSGGPILITGLISECIVGGDATAATVQYAATATGLSQQTISAASGSVANAGAHATVSLIGTALTTAAVYNSKGVNLAMSPPGGIVIPVGTIDLVIGSGPTVTGTWRHIIRYQPMVIGAKAA